jgi:hypothetical protein
MQMALSVLMTLGGIPPSVRGQGVRISAGKMAAAKCRMQPIKQVCPMRCLVKTTGGVDACWMAKRCRLPGMSYGAGSGDQGAL